jgi:hypothetical protein
MKKAILILLILTYNATHAQVSSSLTIKDTRSLNDLPNFFDHGIRADFKDRSTIGVPGEGTYSTNLTFAQWDNWNNSGGKNHQLNFNDGGLFYRSASPLDVRWGGWRQILMENENGKVGVGTTDPISKLSISGSLTLTSGLINTSARPSVTSNTLDYGEIRGYNGGSILADDGFIRMSAGGGTNGTVKSYIELSGYSTIPDMDRNIVMGTSGNERLRIDKNGNVGIGSTNPDSKLTVKGKIHAEEVKVTQTVPADYVFEKYYLGQSSLKPDYTLLSLSEVEKFTEANHHLPNVPSAKEIKENGLLLGEMSNVLLQKIEELTLYSIEQKKTIDKQASAIERLEKENDSFKKLEERLNRLEKELATKK